MLARLRLHRARADAIAKLSLLAIPTGLFVGAVVIVFRILTENSLVWLDLLPAIDRYESLPPAWRFLLPTVGGLAIGLSFQAVPAAHAPAEWVDLRETVACAQVLAAYAMHFCGTTS